MERIKKLFFEETLKHWHFNEIVRQSGLSRERVNHYLNELLKIRFLRYVKPINRMPYYTANRESDMFRFKKKIYGLNMLYETGLFEHISSMQSIKTAIIFGSFSRGDFGKSSDVDLFIFGNADSFEMAKFEELVKRDIHLVAYDDVKLLKKELDPTLIPNIIKGFNIKGDLEPFEVEINA